MVFVEKSSDSARNGKRSMGPSPTQSLSSLSSDDETGK